MGCSKPKITIEIMGLRERLDQDERIGEPYWELSSIFGTDSLKFGSTLTTCIHNSILYLYSLSIFIVMRFIREPLAQMIGATPSHVLT